MPVIRSLEYYGGNENNKRYLESLVTALPAPAATTIVQSTVASEIALGQSLIEDLQSDLPTPPAVPPTWRAKA